MAELDSFLFLEWPILKPMGALEYPPFVSSLLDTEALLFLRSSDVSRCPEHITNMWVVKGGSSGWLGFSAQLLTDKVSGVERFWMKVLKLQFSSISTEASGFESMFSIPSSTINLSKVGSSRGLLKISAKLDCYVSLVVHIITPISTRSSFPFRALSLRSDPGTIVEGTNWRETIHLFLKDLFAHCFDGGTLKDNIIKANLYKLQTHLLEFCRINSDAPIIPSSKIVFSEIGSFPFFEKYWNGLACGVPGCIIYLDEDVMVHPIFMQEGKGIAGLEGLDLEEDSL
ncbi:hypothetical protein Tco_0573171 [Tanacetum coccineum]